MRYLLDTNICIYLMRHQPPEVAARFWQTPAGDVAISAVTYAELRHGVERCDSTERAQAARALARFIGLVPVLALDERAAEQFGSLSAAVRERRRDVLDRLIAAHARSVNAVLVTNNEADFRGMPGLVVENWVLKLNR